MITLSHEQEQAVMKLLRWFKAPSGDQVFRIAGYAGVGKSTVVKYAMQALELAAHEVAFVTFTGKASIVLTRKGNPAQTIHRFCYEPLFSSYRDPSTGIMKTKVSGFKLREDVPDVKLIVIDEVSMVSEQLLRDLRSFKIKILALGDPGQLPPVMGKDNGLLKSPDVFLDKIHRQAADSPIIWASMLAREGRTIPYGVHGGKVRVIPRAQVSIGDVLNATQVLACTHKTRVQYNAVTREYLGYDTKLPLPGEKLICLANRWETFSTTTLTPLVNGLQVRVTEQARDISSSLRSFWTTVEAEEVPGDFYPAMEVNLDYFDPLPGQDPDTGADVAHFDFGYAITVHKSQGSEFHSVLAIDDVFGSFDEVKRLRYTAWTRPIEYLTIAL